MDNFTDLFSGDAFTMQSLSAAINEVDHIPGRAGQLVFASQDVLKPVNTLSVVIERVGEDLKLIQTTARGAPAEKLLGDKRSMISLDIPHIQLEDTIYADSVQNVRQFGTSNQLTTVESAVNKSLTKIAHRLDFTLEHHRLGAVLGVIRDADGSVLTDIYSAFGYLNSLGFAAPEPFNFDLNNPAVDVRLKAQDVTRYMRRHAKTILPRDALPWAFCGDNFFDKLISHADVKDAYRGSDNAAAVLGGNYAFGVFEHGGIVWENYQGSDDNSTIAVDPNECRFFFANAPELYSESYAPADYIETVNTPGLPRYAKIAVDPKFQKFVELEAQTNPLPLCLRPATLCKGTIS
ncbi:major capsid protein [Bradyrhizobium sediminis]|uniref:Major capsid protein n=1 Tax=Bradyrhizobium sediminis TaxID=2840469 RepID=A0A975NME1_9BRAD|nr:major capsid protein [Bradyrhizobium sediminis]QWG17853.1 major capsid protein [Bradyrhizobium sediminis]